MSDTPAASRRVRRRSPWPRRLLATGLVLLVLVLGIAIGQALNDGPPPPATETYVRTLTTVTDEVSTTGP